MKRKNIKTALCLVALTCATTVFISCNDEEETGKKRTTTTFESKDWAMKKEVHDPSDQGLTFLRIIPNMKKSDGGLILIVQNMLKGVFYSCQ